MGVSSFKQYLRPKPRANHLVNSRGFGAGLDPSRQAEDSPIHLSGLGYAPLRIYMRPFTDTEIIKRVESLPTFAGWQEGFYDIWVRSKADSFDQFDDRAFTYQVVGASQTPKFLMARTGTSNAGSFGLLHFNTYNSEGCAVLKSDVIVYGSHAYGLHKGKKPAYVQVRPFPYYRDGNKNKRAEEIGPVHGDIIGANIHRAGVFSTLIKNWSVACLVTQKEADFLKWLNILVQAGKPRLNVVILKEF